MGPGKGFAGVDNDFAIIVLHAKGVVENAKVLVGEMNKYLHLPLFFSVSSLTIFLSDDLFI